MADTIEMNEYREEQQETTGGEGSGSVVLQSGNSSILRLRRPPLVGYSTPAAGSSSVSPNYKANIQQIALSIVTLNITTLRALRDGWYGSPQIINRCCDRYEQFLDEDEIELLDWIVEDGGVHFDAHVREYVNEKSHEKGVGWLVDTRTSAFYSQLIDIELKMYRAAQAHSALLLRADTLEIPEAYNYCTSYQSYVEHVASKEQEKRVFLKETLKRAQRLLSAIKVAANDGNLDGQVLEILKLKVLALQEHYQDATAALFETSYDLFDQARVDWWNPSISKTPSDPRERLPAAVARAYEASSKGLISTLSFFVPAILLISCVPIALAWTRSPQEVGASNDANFYQLIAGSLIQLLSLATLLYPTLFHSKFQGHSWLWTWILALFSVACTILSVLIYVFLPVAWSMVVAFGGMTAQALITLQIVHAI
ncbi:hypothetical protein GLAREA_09293 [Glarea lozoyensis ATCC 20868]|uniref:Uncharacterized protein n=1 Tax=Glarea lozoyensis (strain ATCC 20868 / MF5171) TaxID=1116229 RepID=S3DHF5_GLAL2|nr:uncharacterized protein GLAREA_09293 [Glarea lozoyensis ATCC 20868]EPE37130.1 hypothetical protein GLAREA_09293 [Glarea lozoyensis ATCC 20868]